MTVADGKITIVGGGDDIWNAQDSFHYGYITVTGDFDYVVQVLSLEGNAGDGGWAKAELMARLPGADGQDPNGYDPHISNMTTRPSSDTPSGGAAGVNYRGPQWRAHRSNADFGEGNGVDDLGVPWTGVSSWTTPNPVITPNMPNNWVRLERVGSVFYMYWSNDGKAWSMYNPYSPQGWDTAGSWPEGTDNPAQAYFTNAWPAKINLGLAVTAHSSANVSTAVFTNFMAYTPTPIAITQQPPETASVTASMPLNLSVAATGDPVHYEWRKDGKAIPRAVAPTLNVPITTLADSGTYSVRVFGGGKEIMSSNTVVTVTVDTQAPLLVKARADGTFTTVRVYFNEPMGATATNTANYSISPTLGITAADPIPIAGSPGFFNGVKLTTAKQALATKYTLTVNNVKDYSGNTIAANSQVTFMSAQELKGFAFYERWDDANGDLGGLDAFGTALDDTANPIRPPDVTSTVTQFDGPWNAADNYNARLRTFFTPATDGTYIFYVSSDDNSKLYLSTDENPANKLLIAQETGWSNEYQWTNTGSPAGVGDYKCSATFPFVYTGSEPIWGGDIVLKGGTKYYMEARQNEGGGGDGVGATFIKQGDAVPANSAAGEFLKGDVISWYESVDNLTPSILTQPVGSMVLAPGSSTNIWVQAFGTELTYQWQLNGKNIANATATNYTIASASLADIGQYSVVVSNSNGSTTSTLCKVLVTASAAFTIEAEDFDYDGGQTKAEASVMPYLGGAYTNLTAKFDIDYHNLDNPTDSNSGGTVSPYHPIYRYKDAYGDAADDLSNTSADLPNHGVNIADNMGGQWGSTRGGVWTMTSNYKIGWISSGDWGNYTRTFPASPTTYTVFAAQSYDGRAAGQLHSTLGRVTAGVGTTTQTVEHIGTFDCPGSAGWSQNNLVPLTDDAGVPKTVTLSGTQTIRWGYDSGDADYLLFIPAGTQGATLSISASGSTVTITWSDATFGLESASSINGTWTPMTGVTSPATVTPTGTTFYRLKK